MIELRTGLPGACKTLSTVEALSKLLERFDAHPDEARPVFVHNIRDLALPHAALPLLEVTHDTPGYESLQRGLVRRVPDWDAIPDGSLVIVDEAQDLFPPRSSQSQALPYIAWLNTHRHHGVDLWVNTQHPKLIDFSLRALVGKHQHFRRLFGRQVSAVYEWDGCSDNLGGMKDAVMSKYFFPKKAFQWYKSAEVHTKQTFRLPRWLLIPVAGVALGVYAVPHAYTVLTGTMHGKGAALSAATAAQGGKGGAIAPTASASASHVVASVPPVAPASVPVALAKPRIVGCIIMGPRCECFGEDGLRVDVEPAACEDGSHRVGGLVPVDLGRGGSMNAPLAHGDVSRGTRETSVITQGSPGPAPSASLAPAPPIVRGPESNAQPRPTAS